MAQIVLCVCFMNGARSPMMEAILRDELAKCGVKNVLVESAGTSGDAEGQSIDENSARELKRRGINMGEHKGRFIGNIGNLKRFARILCVGHEEEKKVCALCPMEIWNRIQVVNANSGGVSGVWEKGPEAYRVCADIIQKAMAQIALELNMEKPTE